jgi:tRNA(Met) C34 N-acetyltransferase TmcA
MKKGVFGGVGKLSVVAEAGRGKSVMIGIFKPFFAFLNA